MSDFINFHAYLTGVFKGNVRDWRQTIQRTKSETGKVGTFDPSSCFNNKTNTLEVMVNGHNDNTPFYRFRREKELAKVTIKKEDVELIVSI